MFLCFTRPRYQVSVYRTIGPLVSSAEQRLIRLSRCQGCSASLLNVNITFLIFLLTHIAAQLLTLCTIFSHTKYDCHKSCKFSDTGYFTVSKILTKLV